MQTHTFIIRLFIALSAGLQACSEGPSVEFLQHTEVRPTQGDTWPANEPLKILFNDYLDPSSIDEMEVTLQSGEESVPLDLGYDPVDKALLIVPIGHLRVRLGYSVKIPADRLRALSGAQMARDIEWSFRAGTPNTTDPPGAIEFTRDIQPIFENACGCHGPAPKLFPTLNASALVRQPSVRQPDRALVVPGQPLQSYLIQRLLPNYPTVWGEPKTLSDDEKRLLIRWVTEMNGVR